MVKLAIRFVIQGTHSVDQLLARMVSFKLEPVRQFLAMLLLHLTTVVSVRAHHSWLTVLPALPPVTLDIPCLVSLAVISELSSQQLATSTLARLTLRTKTEEMVHVQTL